MPKTSKSNNKNKTGFFESKHNRVVAAVLLCAFALCAALLIIILPFRPFSGIGRSDGPIVARFDGGVIYAADIPFEVTRAENMLFWDYFELFGEFEMDYDRIMPNGQTFGRILLEEAVRMASVNWFFAQHAQRLGVSVTAYQIDEIEANIDEMLRMMGPEDFADAMTNDRIRDAEHLLEIFIQSQLAFNVITAIVDDPAEFAVFEPFVMDGPENVLGARHILAHFAEFDSEEDARAYAEALYARVRAGEDFEMLVFEYGQDPGMFDFPQGYAFIEGAMDDAFYQATLALEIGEISPIVRSSFGYHIIMRIEPPDEHVMGPFGFLPNTMERMQQAVYEGFESMASQLVFEFLPALDELDVFSSIE